MALLIISMMVQVEVVLEEHAKNNTFFGSVFYYDGEKEKDLAIELLQNVRRYSILYCFYTPGHFL